jgi:hypothetical protein
MGGNEVPSHASPTQGIITFLADVNGSASYAVYYDNEEATAPAYSGYVDANTTHFSWAPETSITLDCGVPSTLGKISCIHHYPSGDPLNTQYMGAGGLAALSFYADGWHSFNFTLRESNPTYAYYDANALDGSGWKAEIYTWSNAKSPLFRITRTGPPITVNELRFFDTRYYNPSFDNWVYSSSFNGLSSIPFTGHSSFDLGWPSLSGYWSSSTGEALLFFPSLDTLSKLPSTAKGFCGGGLLDSCNYSFTHSGETTLSTGDTMTLSLESFQNFDPSIPTIALEHALAANVPLTLTIGDEEKEWNFIGTHPEGGKVKWNLNMLKGKEKVVLRCRAVDIVGAPSPYYSLATPITVIPVNSTTTRITP